MSLENFSENYRSLTDKYDLGYIHTFYSDLFTPRKESTKNILEIGTQYGGSVLLWRDYFLNATVFALDNIQCPNLINQERIIHIVGDAYSEDFVKRLPNNFYDIIIDDGPHTYESMVIFLTKYFPLVKSGGLMILEDIIDPSWTPKLVELIDTNMCNFRVVPTAGKQIDTQLRIRWANGLDVIVIEKK